jgi:hypothetical protein
MALDTASNTPGPGLNVTKNVTLQKTNQLEKCIGV